MRYEAPDTIEGAIALLAGAPPGTAKILAGGTDLLVQLRADMVEPDLIVDIKKIAETRGGSVSIESEPGSGTAFHVLLPKN